MREHLWFGLAILGVVVIVISQQSSWRPDVIACVGGVALGAGLVKAMLR